MAGLGLALLGGALKGFGQGQAANIKATRDEKLRQLELDRADRIEASRQKFEGEIHAADRASTEKLTQAQLAMNEKLANLQEAGANRRTDVTTQTQKDINAANIGSTEKMTQAQIDARRDEVADQIASGEKIAGLQIGAQKDIATQQEEAAQQLGIKPMLSADGKTQVWVRPDGKRVEGPKDKDGKEIPLAITDTDTNEMKNVKYLISMGVPAEKAQALIYSSKNADRNLAQAGIYKSIVDGMSTMKNLTGEDFDFALEKSRAVTDAIYGAGGTSPTAPSSATEQQAKPLPPDMTKADVIEGAKAAVAAGKSKAAVRAQLQSYGIDPAEAGL